VSECVLLFLPSTLFVNGINIPHVLPTVGEKRPINYGTVLIRYQYRACEGFISSQHNRIAVD
jgi:hypothetical protein